MRILVGTLYTIENEFEDCCRAIQQQTHQDFEHFVIRNKQNKEAHDELYQTFMDRSDEFEILIKVDADMVLTSQTFFKDVITVFQKHDWLKKLTVDVHDFFTNSMVDGLNIYRNTIEWSEDSEMFFVDNFPINDEHNKRDQAVLAPAAMHCPDPSAFQSFHFGAHKAIKVMQVEKKRKNYIASQRHWNNYIKLCEQYELTGDRNRGLAVLGAEVAFARNYSSAESNYHSVRLRKDFDTCIANINNDGVGLSRELNKYRSKSGANLPSELRFFLLKTKGKGSLDNRIRNRRSLIRLLQHKVRQKITL